MFAKNINALKTKNPTLAGKLEKISLEAASDVVSVLQANSGDLIIAYNNYPLEDIEAPLTKAKSVWETTIKHPLESNDIVLVFGLGLGYLFKRAYISCPSRIIVFEPRIEVLRFVLEYVDFSSEILDSRVYFTCDQENCQGVISEKFISKDRLEFVFSELYASLFTSELLTLSEKIVNICESKNADVTTIKTFSKSWVRNSIVNLKYVDKSRPLSFLKDKFKGKTALIIAAGPSLRNDVELIKKNREKFVIFAVNKIFDYLIKNGIEPDFLVASDARFIKDTITVMPEVFGRVNLLATSKTDSFIFEQNFNSIILYYLENDEIFEEIRQKYPQELKGYETEGTSVSQAYYAAVEMGFDSVIFSGLDLAIKPDSPYANDLKMTIDETGNAKVFGETRGLVEVKSFSGENVLTRHDYSIFIKQLQNAFLSDLMVTKYNTTDFGALIEGMTYKNFNDILPDLKELTVSVNEIIDEVFFNTKNKWEEIISFKKEYLKKEQSNLSQLKHKVLEWIDKYSHIINSSNNVNEKNKSQLIRAKNSEIDLLNLIIKSNIMASYVQAELLEFSKINKTDSDFIKARKYSLVFFKDMIQHIDSIWWRIYRLFE